MTTLTDFLLARITEDEAVAQSFTYNWSDAQELLRRRFVAECEAKRRIVGRASRSVVSVTSERPSPFGNLSFSEGRYFAPDGRDVTDEFAAWHAVDGEPADPETLRDLASVYADHPDYREEWKP